jgi:hypothetical protein
MGNGGMNIGTARHQGLPVGRLDFRQFVVSYVALCYRLPMVFSPSTTGLTG